MNLRLPGAVLAFAMGNVGLVSAANTIAPDVYLTQQGRALFLEKSCSHCHGPDTNNGVKFAGRDDLTEWVQAARLTDLVHSAPFMKGSSWVWTMWFV